MNIKEIKELLQLMKEHGLTEIELEKDGLKLKLRKGPSGKSIAEYGGEVAPMVMPIPMAGNGGGEGAAKDKLQPQESVDIDVAKSPMVGTFYAAPSPDQPPYVSIGQAVKKGDVLCIIEAMKLMNEIKCEVNGTISEILVNNGQAVEFDQPLFKIKTS